MPSDFATPSSCLIKAVELEAERLQQEAMYARVREALLGEAVPAVVQAARANVGTYGTMCRAVFAPAAVDTLLAALEKMPAEPR